MRKTILITGSSSGIGKATAKYFHSKGWNVAATMRNPEKETELNALANMLVLKLDVTDTTSIQNAIRQTIEKFGSIDSILNNAGYGLTGAFEAATPEEIQRQFDTNVFGSMNVTREILPYFRQRKSGTIIQVASMGGRFCFPFYSLYHSTKWAIEGFCESLYYELRPFNVKVKIIEPGPIQTDFYGRSMDVAKKDGLDAYNKYIEKAFNNTNGRSDYRVPPEYVAKIVYKAANSNNFRLRYQTDFLGSLILFLRWLLPDSVFTFLIRKGAGL